MWWNQFKLYLNHEICLNPIFLETYSFLSKFVSDPHFLGLKISSVPQNFSQGTIEIFFTPIYLVQNLRFKNCFMLEFFWPSILSKRILEYFFWPNTFFDPWIIFANIFLAKYCFTRIFFDYQFLHHSFGQIILWPKIIF